jgi:hypothetical protein
MVRTRWASTAILIIVGFLLSGFTKSVADTIKQQRAAAALFDQYETVFYARGDLLSTSGGYKRLSKHDANAMRAPFADLLQALDPLGKVDSVEILRNTDAALVGAKDFRPPGGPPPNLGAVQSRFCYVLVSVDRSAVEFSKIAPKSHVISTENSVWKWSAPPAEGHSQPYTFYAKEIAHSYLLISNELNDLHAIATELDSDTVPDISGFRYWDSISKHEVWGYRRYMHTELNKTAAGTMQVTSDAQAIAFFANPEHKTAVLLIFSPTPGTAHNMNETGIFTPFMSAGKGVWQTQFPLNGDQKASDQMFAVMSWFGFGVYI